MIGSIDKDKDKRLAAKRVQSTQALASNAPQQIGNYDVQFDKSVPMANRQAFARQPTNPGNGPSMPQQRFAPIAPAGYQPRQIEAPKTMGDMLRYNREKQMQRQNADIAQKNAQSSIAAFNAQRQAEHLERADATAALGTRNTGEHYQRSDETASERNRITGEHYTRSDATASERNQITGEHYNRADATAAGRATQIAKTEDARTKIAQDVAPSEQALREAQTSQALEQTKQSEHIRDNSTSQVELARQQAQARMQLGADPNNPEYRAKVQALENTPNAGLTAKDAAKIGQGDMANFIRFKATLDLNTSDKDATKMYLKRKQQLEQGFVDDVDDPNDPASYAGDADEYLDNL